jgi:hypothetical protein
MVMRVRCGAQYEHRALNMIVCYFPARYKEIARSNRSTASCQLFQFSTLGGVLEGVCGGGA